MIEIKLTDEFGRGLYAEKNIETGKTIEFSETLILNEVDTIKVNETDLKWYTFKFNEKQDCLVLGNGEIFNHADAPNVSYDLVSLNGRWMMRFKTTREIVAGEQLFIDYQSDTKVNPEGYKINLI